MNLPGVPENLDVVRLGAALNEEYVFIDEAIKRGVMVSGGNHVIVKPADGHEFAFDIRTNTYVCVPKLDRPKLFIARLSASNQVELDAINALRGNDLVMSIEEVEEVAEPTATLKPAE